VKKFHHIGVVSKSLELATETYQLESSNCTEIILDLQQQNRLYFFITNFSEFILEIIVPLNEKSTVYNFCEKNVIGLHHFAFEVDNLEEAIDSYVAKQGNFLIGKYSINVKTFGGKINTAFIYSNYNLIELVQVI
jgi:hypothetical protein